MAPTAPDSGLARAVRQRLGLGRLLPLGGAADGCWLAESAAVEVLRRACATVDGVVLGPLRVGPAEPGAERGSPVVPPPPGSLPPGPLAVRAECEAAPEEPLPATARRLRAVLHTAAAERLGLVVTEVDLRVTGLLDASGEGPPATGPTGRSGPAQAPPGAPAGPEDPAGGEGPEALAARAAAAVPGVARLSPVLGGRPVHHDAAAPAGPHVRVELAVTGGHRALDVALAVRAAVADAVPGRPSVSVLVTDVTE
ncbi:nucleopolyhedrovirus P10 family protein [Streptomyces sp. NPDC004111]|uniref:nucleopolyhedrovirus P10 family protein n=1 Tax=Streptomyces sp. NPDC004111 TaxID=3364690 RepID=UPI00368C9B0C